MGQNPDRGLSMLSTVQSEYNSLFTITKHGLLLVILFTLACSMGSTEDKITLKEAYGNAFLIGAAINSDIASGTDLASQKIVTAQFNTITPENVMKAESINPLPGIYNFGPADAFVDFAENNSMFIVGHTLVWHNQTPDWFFYNENGSRKLPEELIQL